MLDEISALTANVKQKAHDLGFDLVGVTTCDPPEHRDIFEAWLEAGFHGEMAWMATERAVKRRADPKGILSECQSILVLGMRHDYSLDDRVRDGYGRIASYAWGEDYHDVIPPLLKALVEFIEEQIGHRVPNRWYTDTGPVLERELAQRAGLGWVGKNSCLINPKEGSFFFLAEILLGIALKPDKPLAMDYCGSCTRCIDACPTKCIQPNRTIDAQRCISYLTIELRANIPDDLRSLLGDWVFGCDVCQQVCPWNEHARYAKINPAFKGDRNMPYLDLEKAIGFSTEEFNRTFKKSAVKRSKRRGLLRNIAVVMGNQKLPASIDGLANALQHESEVMVRCHAAWALGQIKSERAFKVLEEAYAHEHDEEVLRAIELALGNQQNDKEPSKNINE